LFHLRVAVLAVAAVCVVVFMAATAVTHGLVDLIACLAAGLALVTMLVQLGPYGRKRLFRR
jgi:hypothetical protein